MASIVNSQYYHLGKIFWLFQNFISGYLKKADSTENENDYACRLAVSLILGWYYQRVEQV